MRVTPTRKRIATVVRDQLLNEETLARAWLSGAWRRIEPVDTVIEVIYPGRRKRSSGPDFVDAVVNIAGRRLTGAIEIHLDAGSWHTHQHHLDPAYNDTILHVVLNTRPNSPTVTAEGRIVPQVILPLPALASKATTEHFNFPCRNGKNILSVIKWGGMARFEFKSRLFLANLRLQPPDEVIYCGIASALGYMENQTPMRALAEAMTLATIRNSGLDRRPDLLEALMLRNAGLLTELSASTDPEAYRLWRLLPNAINMPAMSRGQWHFARVRPANSPPRRLAALTHLINRHRTAWLCAGLLEPLHSDESTLTTLRTIEKNLIVTANDYWSVHSDFGRPLPRPYALLGAERASAIAANVILPFAHALGRITGNIRLSRTALKTYEAYPAIGGNEITSYMSQMLSLPVKTVRQEQGMIHLYRNWCRDKRCPECPAASRRPGRGY
jgi:hypothetical protein